MSQKATNKFLVAYKKYFIHQVRTADPVNKIIWKEKIDGEFLLTEGCIRILLENALKANHKWPYGKIKSVKQAKAIAEQFRLLNRKGNLERLDDFSSLFNLLPYVQFTRRADVNQKWLDMNDKPAENMFEHSDNYVFYFWEGRNLGRAHAEFEVTSQGWGRVFIDYYVFNKMNATWISRRLAEGAPVEKEFAKKAAFESKVIGNNLHIVAGYDHITFLIIHTTDGNFKKNSLFCTFSTTFHGHLGSGVGILEKITQGSVVDAIKKEPGPRIFNLLFQRRLSLSSGERDYSPKPGRKDFHYKSEFFVAGKGLAGVYKGYYLDKAYNDTEQAIRTLLLQIEPSGKVILNDGEPPTRQYGFCSIPESRVLYITSDFQYEVGGVPRTQITLEMPQAGQRFLQGIYGGFRKTNQPYIGLICLEKLDEKITDINVALNSEELAPRNFLKSNQNNTDFHRSIPMEVIKHFAEEKFYNGPVYCISPDLLNAFSGRTDNSYKGPKGFFHIYAASSHKKGIVRYPIWIQNDGKVIMKSYKGVLDGGSAIMYCGLDFLILNFHQPIKMPEKRPTKGVFAFCLAHQEEWTTLPGISLRVNDEDKAQAKREFLVPILAGEDIKDKSFAECNDFFETLKFEILYPGFAPGVPSDLMNALLGREYNLIVVSREIKSRKKILQRYNFKRLYLFDALFEFQKAREKLNERFEEAMELAIEHGLYKPAEFKKLLLEYCKVHKKPMQKYLAAIGPSYQIILKKYFKNPKKHDISKEI